MQIKNKGKGKGSLFKAVLILTETCQQSFCKIDAFTVYKEISSHGEITCPYKDVGVVKPVKETGRFSKTICSSFFSTLGEAE